jgi:hypothetical protein
METTATTISWNGMAAVGFNSDDTCQIAANAQRVVQLFSINGSLSSVVGIPQSGGTIQWGTPQTNFDVGDHAPGAATLAVSSNGTVLSFHVTSAFESRVLWGDIGVLDTTNSSDGFPCSRRGVTVLQ